MLFQYRYAGNSAVTSNASSTGMTFAPDTYRDPTYFDGELRKNVPFREAISALHDVVVSDLRFQPKDKTEYKRWAAEQEEILLGESLGEVEEVAARVGEIRGELATMNQQRSTIMSPFYAAQRKYFNHLYRKNRDWWWVLDPVITVHPDELFFECFSVDESTYGRLGCNYGVFQNVGEFACGTTNVDYSDTLYREFQKVRDYKTTKLSVDPSGFEVETTAEDSYKEVKIDLPESWVRGFLQVSSAMTLPGYTFDLHPMDVHNFCFQLRRFKERKGPRSMRYILKPGEPVRVVFEPWNTEILCPRSIYHGKDAAEIRVWGRRRILILERLLSVAKRFRVTLLGTGMPSFYVADLGDMNFTLGLSGWTANDWSRVGNFDLMAPRASVDDETKQKVFAALKETWFDSPQNLAKRLGMDQGIVEGALSAWTQAGRAIYDLNQQVYRVRELSRDPLPMEKLRFSNPREKEANRIFLNEKPKVRISVEKNGKVKLSGKVKAKKVQVVIDRDERMIEASCSCNFYTQNKLYQGPCEHMIALRMAGNEKLNPEEKT